MKLEYYIFDPAGNITALVTSKVDKKMYGNISAAIMQADPSVEQVGFVDLKGNTIYLNMSGDEFCGNAAMSAAVLCSILESKKGKNKINVMVLPMKAEVTVEVENTKDGYSCLGYFKTPEKIADYSFGINGKKYSFKAVSVSGITHIIADETLSEQTAKCVIKKAADDLLSPAVGIMLYNEKTGVLRPLVYVKAVDTLFLENSCASGSCAIAATVCKAGESIILKEPGGSLKVTNNGEYITIGEIIKFNKKCLEEI